jgi:hypothetical protein
VISNGKGQGPVAVSHEIGNDISSPIKGGYI